MSLEPRARSTIASARLRQLHDYWNQRRAGRRMPARADIDPLDIPRLLPNLLLIDVETGSGRLKVRVAGTHVVEMYGSDYTGRYLDEIDFGDRRAAVRALSLARVRSWPPMVTRPASGVSSRPAICKSVDFPAPDGATSATTSPGAMLSEAPRSTRTSPGRPSL